MSAHAVRYVVALLALLHAVGTVCADPKMYRRLLLSTGWIVVPSPEGMAAATCFVADREHGLLLTSGHVVGKSAEALIYFPRWQQRGPILEAQKYLSGTAALQGRVVAHDSRHDLALIRVAALPDDVKAIPLAEKSAEPGESRGPWNRGNGWEVVDAPAFRDVPSQANDQSRGRTAGTRK